MIKVKKINDGNGVYVGTHNGIFHCDEVVAVSILSILTGNKEDLNVIRSRDLEFLKNSVNIMVDIGGGEFDHHQKGGNGQRENGAKYASAGLIWKKYGNQVIKRLSGDSLDSNEINEIVDLIDKDVIQSVDMEDNGQLVSSHLFKFITSYLPNWNEELNYDENFEEAVNVATSILKKTLKSYIALHLAKKELNERVGNSEYHVDNVLEIPCQTIPWTEYMIDYNNKSDEKIDFVVFNYPAGGYALQCVPPAKENIFGQRISLPKNWAGETTNLPEISGIPSATFCHNGRFFARANEKEDIFEMCNKATRSESMILKK